MKALSKTHLETHSGAPAGARAALEEAFEEPPTPLNSIPGPLRAPAQRSRKHLRNLKRDAGIALI